MARSSETPGGFRLGELAVRLGGSLEGDPTIRIVGFASLSEAVGGQLSFYGHPRYRPQLCRTAASAVIVAEDFVPPRGCRDGIAWVRVADPYRAMAEALALLYPARRPEPGIHPTAVVGAGARLGSQVHLGPWAVVGAGARVGDRVVIEAGCVLGPGVEVGPDCWLHPRVVLYEGVTLGRRVEVHAGAIIGAHGFGYAREGDRYVKVPQVGGVVVGDDVEIGANVCIDRATCGATRIGRGTKIDNLVQIGHNCQIGADCVLCGQVGLGGSTVVGDGVVIGGQAGVAGHLSIGEGAMLAGQTGVTNDIPAGARVAGYPHLDVTHWRRAMAALRRLPELVRRVRRLEAGRAPSKEPG